MTILRDAGCSGVVIKRDLVRDSELMVTLSCVF